MKNKNKRVSIMVSYYTYSFQLLEFELFMKFLQFHVYARVYFLDQR